MGACGLSVCRVARVWVRLYIVVAQELLEGQQAVANELRERLHEAEVQLNCQAEVPPPCSCGLIHYCEEGLALEKGKLRLAFEGTIFAGPDDKGANRRFVRI